MEYINIDEAISLTINLESDEPCFSYIYSYMFTLPVTDNTENVFLEDINGDWETDIS